MKVISDSGLSAEEQAIRLNLTLLNLALGVESISRPDPETFLREQMTLWNQGSYMWLHTLLESGGNDGFGGVAQEFQADPLLPSTLEQTHRKQGAHVEV